jgi:AbrB family looped-hinge helix DNA binding protein
MTIETIRMSSKGQVVIPFDIREEIDAQEGTLFAVIGSEDTIVLKKLETPSKEEMIKGLAAIAKEGKKRLHGKGFSEADLRAK